MDNIIAKNDFEKKVTKIKKPKNLTHREQVLAMGVEEIRKAIEIAILNFFNVFDESLIQPLPHKIETYGVDVSDIIKKLSAKGYTCNLTGETLTIS